MGVQCSSCGEYLSAGNSNCPACGATQPPIKTRYVIATVLVVAAVAAIKLLRN
jgi:uncharacterized OB-fold protein